MRGDITGRVIVETVDNATNEVVQRSESTNAISAAGAIIGFRNMFGEGQYNAASPDYIVNKRFLSDLFGFPYSNKYALKRPTIDFQNTNMNQYVSSRCNDTDFGIALLSSDDTYTSDSLVSPLSNPDNIVYSTEEPDPSVPFHEAAYPRPTQIYPWFDYAYNANKTKLILSTVWTRVLSTENVTIKSVCTGGSKYNAVVGNAFTFPAENNVITLFRPVFCNKLTHPTETSFLILKVKQQTAAALHELAMFASNSPPRIVRTTTASTAVTAHYLSYGQYNVAPFVYIEGATGATTAEPATAPTLPSAVLQPEVVGDISATVTVSGGKNSNVIGIYNGASFGTSAATNSGTMTYYTARTATSALNANLPLDIEYIGDKTRLLLTMGAGPIPNSTFAWIKCTHFSPTKGFFHQVDPSMSATSISAASRCFWANYAIGTLADKYLPGLEARDTPVTWATTRYKAEEVPGQRIFPVCMAVDPDDSTTYIEIQTDTDLPVIKDTISRITTAPGTIVTAAAVAGTNPLPLDLTLCTGEDADWKFVQNGRTIWPQWCTTYRADKNAQGVLKKLDIADLARESFVFDDDASAASNWFSYSKLSAPITKTPSQTLRLTYQYEIDLA